MGYSQLRWLRAGMGLLLVCVLSAGQAVAGEDLIQAGNVVVTATKTDHLIEDVPVKTEVITRREIEDRQLKTLQEALEHVPGLRVDMDSGSWGDKGKVSIRGMESRHVLILVDGHRIYGGHDASVDLQSYPTEMIERIEVVKGPGSALYGSEAMGGVINVITRKAEDGKDFSASAAAGSRNRRIMEATGSWKSNGMGSVLSYTSKHSDGVDPDYDQYKENAIQGTLSYDLSPRAEISLKPYFSEHRMDYEDRIQQRVGVNPSWQWKPDNLSTLRLWGSWFRYDHESSDEQTGETATEYAHDMYETEINYSRLFSGRHLLTLGSQFEREERDDKIKEYKAEEDVLSFFVSDEIDFNPLVLVLGVRVDEHDEWGSEVTPKFSLAYRVSDAVKLRSSVGRGVNAPTLSKLYGQWRMGPYAVQPNPDLEPEESWGYDMGADWNPTKNISLSATLFQNEVDNLIVSRRIRQGAPPWDLVWENVEKARIRGGEVSTAIVITDDLTADFGYTYLDTENLDTGMELGERPMHQVSMRLGYFWRQYGISAFLEGQYRGRRYADEDNEERLDEYAVFDIVLNKDFGDHYQGFVRVDNILNKKDVTDAYDVDGTEFLAGVQMNF